MIISRNSAETSRHYCMCRLSSILCSSFKWLIVVEHLTSLQKLLGSEPSDCLQIADFGMSRDLMDENYYVSHGGQIPVKWTAPEVWRNYNSCMQHVQSSVIVHTGSAFQEVLHCQWCVELWSCDVWDMEPGTQTIWGVFKPTGKAGLRKPCTVSWIYFHNDNLSLPYGLLHGPSAPGNEAGRSWVPPPPSPRLPQGHIWTHDQVLVSFYCIPYSI